MGKSIVCIKSGKAELSQTAAASHTASLAGGSAASSAFLRRIGVTRGDRVLVLLPSVTSLWEITLAIMKLGAVISPASTLLSAQARSDRLEPGGRAQAAPDVRGFGTLYSDTAILSRTGTGAEGGRKSY